MTETLPRLLLRLSEAGDPAMLWGRQAAPHAGRDFERLLDHGVVDLPLATDWERKPRQRVDFERGRAAQTAWTVLAREGDATRMRLVPHTGRTHQLRVHMLALGHPILGDPFYAEGPALAGADRLQLHAEMLAFTHPTSGEPMRFEIPAPF